MIIWVKTQNLHGKNLYVYLKVKFFKVYTYVNKNYDKYVVLI